MVDARATLNRESFAHQIYHILSELLVEATHLPLVSLGDGVEDEDETPIPIFEDIKAKAEAEAPARYQVYKSLQDKFGDWDSYSLVFNPITDNEAIRASLADDLADVYHDLKEGVVIAASNIPINHKIFEWRLDFSSHWGLHAVDALKTLHFLVDR